MVTGKKTAWFLYCPNCRCLVDAEYKPGIKCPDCNSSMEKALCVKRIKKERVVFLVLWALVFLVTLPICRFPEGIMTGVAGWLCGISMLIVCCYILAAYFKVIHLHDWALEEEIRSDPTILKFSWDRFFSEFIYCIFIMIGVGGAIIIGEGISKHVLHR